CSAFVSLPVQSRSGPCSKAWQALHSLYSIIPATGARTGEHAQPNEGNSRRSTMTQRLLCVSGQRRKRRRKGPAWDSKAAPVLLVHIFIDWITSTCDYAKPCGRYMNLWTFCNDRYIL